jgi:casein kinase 1
MYFLRGSLPWQGLKAATNKQKYEKIGEKKQSTAVKDLCGAFPEEFGIYLQYVRKLGFEETPDYAFLRELFDKVLERQDQEGDCIYDWNLLNDGKGWENRFKQLKEARARRSNHHQQHQQQQQMKHQNSKRTRTPNNSKPVDMPNTPAYVPLNNTKNDHHTASAANATARQQLQQQAQKDTGRKEKHGGFWKNFIAFVTCSGSNSNTD